MAGKEKQASFITQGIILAAASVIVRLIGLIYRIPLANTIGDDGLGAYSNAFEVYNIALLLSTYSIPTAISKLISEREDKKEYGNSYHLLQVGLGFAAILGFIASLLLFVCSSLHIQQLSAGTSLVSLMCSIFSKTIKLQQLSIL